MFYLLKRTDEKQFTLGDVVMVLADFSGVPAGTKGVVTEIYDSGVSVAWAKDGKTIEMIRAGLDSKDQYAIIGARGFTIDGFARGELEYLAVQTDKHPKVL